jgi:uncharacterized protein (TIGR03067 family)
MLVKPLPLLLAAHLALPLLLGSDVPRVWDGEAAFDPLEGEWQEVGATLGGAPVGFAPLPFAFHGGRVTVGQREDGESTGHFRFNPRQGAGQVTVTLTRGRLAGRTWRMLVRVDGDTLRFAFVSGAEEWPPGFEGADVIVSTYRRDRKK